MRSVLRGIVYIAAAFVLSACSMNETSGPSPALPNSSWVATSIDDSPVIDDAQPSLAFDANLNVSGNSSCNRLTGSATVAGKALNFGALATTRMACAEALMEQELRFFVALNEVQSWAIDPDSGELLLNNSAGRPIIRLDPATAEE